MSNHFAPAAPAPAATPPAPVSSSSRRRVDSRDERALVTYVAHITLARPLVPATSNYRANLVSVSSNESLRAQHIGSRGKIARVPLTFQICIRSRFEPIHFHPRTDLRRWVTVSSYVAVSHGPARDFGLAAHGVCGFSRIGWVGCLFDGWFRNLKDICGLFG